MTHWAENQKKKDDNLGPGVYTQERERETCWRDSFIRLSHVSCCCCCTGRYDGATPNSGWPVREIQALSKKGISLSTWATHAKKTHTQEREGETRCRQITAAHKVGQTGGGGFDVVQKKLCTTKKRKWPTHTHTSLGRRLGLTFALDQKICVCNLTQVIFEKANNRKKESDFLVDSEKEKKS